MRVTRIATRIDAEMGFGVAGLPGLPGVIRRTRTRSTCPRGSKKIKQRSAALVALTLVAPRDLLRGQHDSVSGEFDEELMVL